MDQSEVDEFFGAAAAGGPEADGLFIRLVSDWQETQGPIAIHILRRYKKSYSARFRGLVLKYASLLLLNPEIARQRDKIILAGPAVLVPHLAEIGAALEDLAAVDEAESIFAPVLYKLGIRAVAGNHQGHLLALRSLVALPGVSRIFARPYAWGLEPNDHNCYASFNYAPDIAVAGGVCAAVIDAFLEPFLYRRDEDGCALLQNKAPYELRELGTSAVKEMLDYQYDVYALLLLLIKKDAQIKENFIAWLRTVYLKNKERNKMMFDRAQAISDGYAFNLNGVLANFCRGIVEKRIADFDLGWFADEKIIALCGPGDAPGRQAAGFTFPTAVFFSKAVLGNLSFSKILEKMSEFSMRLTYIDRNEAALVRTLESLLSAYRVVLYSEMCISEIPFLHHMADYALQHPVPEIFLNFYLNLGDFLVGKFDFEPSAPLCARILESPELSLHSKVPAVKIIFNSDIKVRSELLVKFYIDIEKMDAGERRGVRYYLNRILVAYDVHDVKFINCMLRDLETLLSDGLGALADLKKGYDQKKAQQAKSSFFCLAELFRLLRKTIEQSPDLFLEKEILPQFVTILNYNLKIVVGPRCSELKCPEAGTSLGFEPKEFLREMLTFYMAMCRHSERFLVAVVKDTMYFNVSLLKRAHRICDAKGILECEELAELAAMVVRAEELIADNVEDDQIVPEQFIDPVTCMPMREPVRLRTSSTVIDKSTFDMLLMNSGVDPFSREVLAADGYAVEEALKREIDEYWSKKKT